MKKITSWGSVLALLLIAIGVQAQGVMPCRFIPAVPVVGQELKIVYDNRQTPLAGADAVDGVVYYWEDLRWEAADLNLVKNDTAWEATCVVPERCALIACKFYDADTVDSGGRSTYATMTFDGEGRNLPGAYLGWGMLRNRTLESLPGYCDSTAYIGDDVMRYWLNQQMVYDPDARRYVFYYAAKLLNVMNPGGRHEQMLDDVDYVLGLPDADEETLLRALEVAQNIVKDSAKAAEVKARVLRDYPDGILARDGEIWRLFQISDPMAKTVALDSFLVRFPAEKFKDVETETASLYLSKIFQSAIYEPIVKRDDYGNLYKYLHVMPRGQLLTCYWHMVQIPLRNKLRTLVQVDSFATAIYDERMARPRCGSERMWSPKEWRCELLSVGKDMAMTQAAVLDANGHPAEALELMEEIKGYFDFASADFNDQYVRMLAKNGYASMVIPVITESLKRDAVTPAMLDTLRKDYVARHGGDKDFDTYVASLKSPEQRQALLDRLRSEMVEEDITLYAMKDLDGNTVDLSAMKGKIIILDFWATWCAPCKASFPGMQMAVNKYKDDPDVAFYFISTMEHDKDFKDEIREFLRANNYTLHVLLDNENSATGKGSAVYDAYAKQFRFSGIPHKMVIDTDGKLRWNLTGYFGSPSALAEELSAMIEMLKAGE